MVKRSNNEGKYEVMSIHEMQNIQGSGNADSSKISKHNFAAKILDSVK